MSTSSPFRRAVLQLVLGAMPCVGLAKPSFVISTLDPGVSISQTVAWARLGDDAHADLMVVSATGKGRFMRVYGQRADDRYDPRPLVAFPLPEDAIVMDTGRLGERDVLVLFTASRAIAYDPFTGVETPLISFTSIFNLPIEHALPKMNLFRDVNGDGRDDFVIPCYGGYEVFLQGKDGRFMGAFELDAPARMDLDFGKRPQYQPRKLFLADMTLDGRPDMVFRDDDGFLIYRQLPDGTFAGGPVRAASGVPLQYDAAEDVSFRIGREDQSNLTARILYQLRDLDGDHLTDLVTLTIKSAGVFNKRTTYDIYRGKRSPSGLVSFGDVPTSTITSNGIQFDMKENDLNHDGQQDILVSSVHLGFARILKALITGAVNIDLDFYRMDDGSYPRRPNVSRSITARFSLSSGEVFYPFVLVADVDGDGYADLLVQKGSNRLEVFEGRDDDRLFERRSSDIDVDLPNDPDLVELADLNGDGARDIVMRLEKKGEDNRVVVLIAQ